jgi:hypothetical protein
MAIERWETIMHGHAIRTMLLVLLSVWLLLTTACVPKVVITPEVANLSSGTTLISGKIDYDGNAEYLPRTVSVEPSEHVSLVVRYCYEVTYGRDAVNQVIPLFNPLSLIGFPTGSDTVVVTAKLEVIQLGAVVKAYTSVCVLDKYRTIFYEGDSLSVLRKKGLLAVRANIEAQMSSDKELLHVVGREIPPQKGE